MRLPRPDKSGFAMTLYEIATLSAKVRNDRKRWIPAFAGMTEKEWE